MANLDKSAYFLTYNKGTGNLSGDTVVSLRKNFLGEEYFFQSSSDKITFDPPVLSDSYGLVNIEFLPLGSVVGISTINCTATADSDVLNFVIHLNIIDVSSPDIEYPEEDPFNPQSYETKYIIENINIAGDAIKLEILQAKGENPITPISVRGTITHAYADKKDLLQPLIASSLAIDLEANEDLALTDLYTEEESKYKVRLSRNDQIIFFGILKPDGIWEDWVSNRWQISMDAMDGLSILKDLSFVKDTGAPYSGEISQFDALKQCLHRIGFDLPINISIDLPIYEGFIDTDTVLKSVLMNADRFYQDAEKDNIMDCEEVLKSVLEIYSATIIQMNGEWWIYRTLDVKDTMNFYRYEANAKTDIIWNAAVEIGSHIDDYEIFHANANQKKSITPSTQAFRVNYKYGTVKELYVNKNLELGTGIYCEGWFINGLDGRVQRGYNGRGVKVTNDVTGDVIFISNMYPIRVTESDRIIVKFTFYNNYSGSTDTLLKYSFSTANFILSENGWIAKSGNENTKISKNYGRKPTSIEETFNIPSIPEDDELLITLWITKIDVSIPLYPFYVLGIEITPNSSSNYKGEFHTAQRLTRISSVTKADKTVAVGDSLSDIYYGTLYKDTGEPTEKWTRIGDTTGKPILQIMAEDALRIAPRPMYFFEGNIRGYVPYLSNVLINNVPGKYQISKYSYDAQTDINNTNFREYSTDEIADFRYEFNYDYGATTKVLVVP